MSYPALPRGGQPPTFGELLASLRQLELDKNPTGPFYTNDDGTPSDPALEAYARMQYFTLLADQRRILEAAAGYDEVRTLLLRQTGEKPTAAACVRLLGQFLTTYPQLSAAEAEALSLPEFVRRFPPPGRPLADDPPAHTHRPYHPALRAVGEEFRRESERNGRLRLVLVATRPREEWGWDPTDPQARLSLPYEQAVIQREVTTAAAEWGWLDSPPTTGDAVYPITWRLPDERRGEYGALAYGDPAAVQAFCRLARQAADTLPSEYRISPPLFAYGPHPDGADTSRIHRWAEFLFVAEPGLYRYHFEPECPRAWHAATQRDPFLASYAAIQVVLGNDLPAHVRLFQANVERLRATARTFAEADDFGRAVELAAEAARPAAGLSPAVPTDDPTPLGPSIDENEMVVLRALNAAHPCTLHNVNIETQTRLSKVTVQACVKSLSSKGLVHRPNGERKGATVTDAGRDLATRLGERP